MLFTHCAHIIIITIIIIIIRVYLYVQFALNISYVPSMNKVTLQQMPLCSVF